MDRHRLAGPSEFVGRRWRELFQCRSRYRLLSTPLRAQIVGLRGDTSIAERIKYDNLYIDQWSFGADLQILARTVSAILQQKTTTRHAIELEEALEEGAMGSDLGLELGLVEVS